MSLLDTNLDPVLSARQLTRRYGSRIGCKDVSLDLWPGEVLGIVGESGSGKSTLLNMLSGRLEPSAGHVHYTAADGKVLDIHSLDEAQRRRLLRTELGFVHQHPRDGLRMSVSAGANIGERLMANGARHYGNLRATALDWLERVEIPVQRVDDTPSQYSGGMQQRLQIAPQLLGLPLVAADEHRRPLRRQGHRRAHAGAVHRLQAGDRHRAAALFHPPGQLRHLGNGMELFEKLFHSCKSL